MPLRWPTHLKRLAFVAAVALALVASGASWFAAQDGITAYCSSSSTVRCMLPSPQPGMGMKRPSPQPGLGLKRPSPQPGLGLKRPSPQPGLG